MSHLLSSHYLKLGKITTTIIIIIIIIMMMIMIIVKVSPLALLYFS